jgi:beta-1,4-mannosyltransferase
VQQSFPDPRPTTNPYIVMLRDSIAARPDVSLQTFSWRRAILGRYDVFHAHWPEILVGGQSPLKAAVRQSLTTLLLARLRAQRIPIVRTVHNLELPDGLSKRQARILRAFDRQTTLRIRLNDSTALSNDQPVETIVHGHYRPWFARYERSEARLGHLSYFGLIRRYKGVENLAGAFSALRGGLSLRIAGRPSSAELAETLRDCAKADPRITLTLEFLSDATLVEVATEAELVVLPYRHMHNSGGVLTALSLDRPVLVPANEVNERLSLEVGPGWVYQYRGDLTAADLSETLDRVHATARSTSPDLSRREWDAAGERHVEAYRRAITLLRG